MYKIEGDITEKGVKNRSASNGCTDVVGSELLYVRCAVEAALPSFKF
jgi:hypothetical protein